MTNTPVTTGSDGSSFKMDRQMSASLCVQEPHTKFAERFIISRGLLVCTFFFLNLHPFKNTSDCSSKNWGKKNGCSPNNRSYQPGFVWRFYFSKVMLNWVTSWLKKQQVQNVCSSPKLGIAPVTSPFIYPKRNTNILYYGLIKSPLCSKYNFPRFVYSCTSLMYDSVKSHRFSLCLVQGEMSCFSPVPWS